MVLELLRSLPVPDQTVNTLEVSLCLCIDLFTDQRKGGDVAPIRIFFQVLKVYPGLAFFIDRMCARHPRLPLAVAEARAACGEVIHVTSVTLPVAENQLPCLDLQGILNQAVQKMKWQQNSPAIIAECSTNILKAILNEGPLTFNLPVREHEGLMAVIRVRNAPLMTALCVKQPAILKMTIYTLVSDGEVEFLKTLLDQLFESEVAETVLPALCTALLLKPEFIPSVPAVIGDISTRADPSPLIRFMS
jgi:hypothetical protein